MTARQKFFAILAVVLLIAIAFGWGGDKGTNREHQDNGPCATAQSLADAGDNGPALSRAMADCVKSTINR